MRSKARQLRCWAFLWGVQANLRKKLESDRDFPDLLTIGQVIGHKSQAHGFDADTDDGLLESDQFLPAGFSWPSPVV